jgi:ADP-ribosylglycohydrolase
MEYEAVTDTVRRLSGSLFGLAFGDALGAATEFIRYVDDILDWWPPEGPWDLWGDPIPVTDDTQMAIAVGRALVAVLSDDVPTPARLESLLRNEFVRWLESPDNSRSPGRTCLVACGRLAAGERWIDATVPGSKGCGGNMRVAPVGLLALARPDIPDHVRAAVAQFQCALTHGHPTALAASDLTSYAVVEVGRGCEPGRLPGMLRDYAESHRTIYHEVWLGDLWRRSGDASPVEYIARGWDECFDVLDRLDRALVHPDWRADPCLATGEGWVAEEAFATGLLCFLLYPDEPRKAIRRAATTSGDPDSIAALTGAFAGARCGLDVWPSEWLERIEYRKDLREIVERLVAGGSFRTGEVG